MNRKVLSFSILLYLLLMIGSCTNKPNKNPELSTVIDSQEFIKVIPKSRNGKLSYSYKIISDYSRRSKIGIVENGVDSIAIRLWYISDTIQVLDFKKKDGLWAAEFYKMYEIPNADSIYAERIKPINRSPKSGWRIFIDQLFSLGITTLPDFSKLPIYDIPTDGFFVDVEISTTNKYRLYTYGIPYETPDIREVKNVINIMELIENQLGITSLNRLYYLPK